MQKYAVRTGGWRGMLRGPSELSQALIKSLAYAHD